MSIELVISIIAFILSIIGLILSKEVWITTVSIILLVISILNLSKLAYKEYQRRQTPEYIMRTKFPTFMVEGAEIERGPGMPFSRKESKEIDTLLANIQAQNAETQRELAEFNELLKDVRI